MNKDELGYAMKRFRIKAKLKLVDLANLLEVSQPYISMVENGKANMPTKEYLKKFSKVIANFIESEPEKVYYFLCSIGGYSVDKSKTEYLSKGTEVIFLEKPSYDLYWVLKQNNHTIRFEDVVLDNNDQKFILEVIKSYLKAKSGILTSEKRRESK